jgi:hypothetical protein
MVEVKDLKSGDVTGGSKARVSHGPGPRLMSGEVSRIAQTGSPRLIQNPFPPNRGRTHEIASRTVRVSRKRVRSGRGADERPQASRVAS